MFMTLTFSPSEPGSSPSDRRRARMRRRRWHQTVAASAPPTPQVPTWGVPTA